MRCLSSSLISMPDCATTSVSSAVSVAFSTGRDGGPIVPAPGAITAEAPLVTILVPGEGGRWSGWGEPGLGPSGDVGFGERRGRLFGKVPPAERAEGEGEESGGENVRVGTCAIVRAGVIHY